MDAPPKTPAAPTIDRAVQLNEDAQLRVLAGQTTYVAEAKKKKDEEKKEEKKVDEATKTAKPWKDMSGKEHPGTAVKGKNYTGKEAEKDVDKDDDEPKAKKAKKESVEPEFKSKFMKMVEAKKDEADKKKADKKKKMEEGAKPDFLDMDKDGDKKEPMKKAAADKGDDRPAGKKGMSDKQAKYFGKKTESAMMPKGKKRPVKESVETTLSFKQMVQLVQESGGQQQIDPIDKALFTWAERVARNKLGEGMKADLYAGLVYERNGGVFEMYDVLSESKKKVVESRSQLDEGIMDKIKSFAVPKLMKLLGPDAEDIANAVKQATGGDLTANKENAMKVVQALGIDKEASKDKSPEMAEAIAGNWQGKLIQSLYTLGLLGSAGAAASMWGTVGGSFMAIIGTLLIMFAATFFDDDRGMVGAMGKRGNQGFDTNK